MKIWLIVALLAVASSVAVEAEANSTKTAAKVIEADTDLSPISTDVAGDDEGSETTESSQISAIAEEERHTNKGKHEKGEPKEGEQEEGENEEEEGENEEEENEDSEEGDSDEDSEEEESKGKEKKKAKIESDEEGDNKEDAGAIKVPTRQPPVEVPTRSRTIASSPVAAASPEPDLHKTQPKWFFSTPNSKSPDVPAKVESPKFDSTETSTRAAVPVRSSPRPVAKSVAVETRPTYHPTDVSTFDTRKPHHPKWFFNTAKEKSSDGSTKIESPKPSAIFEIPTRKAAATHIPTWSSITTTKPASAVAANKPADSSYSDNRRSHSQWYFNTASKTHDGFARKESNNKPAVVEIPTHNRPASYHAARPWTQSSRPVAPVPVYKPVEVTSVPPRKTYPRWFFNIKS